MPKSLAKAPKAKAKKATNSSRVHVARQLSVFLANQPGVFSRICDSLATAGMQIVAATALDTTDHVVVRMIVNDPHQALRLLEDHGLLVMETDVVMLEGWGQWSNLNEISRILADNKINIEYMYFTSIGARGVLILRPSNLSPALKVLNQLAK